MGVEWPLPQVAGEYFKPVHIPVTIPLRIASSPVRIPMSFFWKPPVACS